MEDDLNPGGESATETTDPPATMATEIDAALGYTENADAAGEGDAAGAQAGAVTKPEPTEAEKAAATAADAAAQAAKPADKADDRYKGALDVPPGLSPKGQNRFQALANMVRERDAKLDEFEATKAQVAEQAEIVKGFNVVFEESKCQPEQFELAMGFIGAVNRGDFQTAEKVLMDQVRLLSLATGREIGAPDPLAEFPDLLEAVEAQQATRKHALEIARARTAERAQAGQRKQVEASQQAQAKMQTAIQQGSQAVQGWVAKMAAEDIDWPAKEARLANELDWIAANVHPSQWVAHLDRFAKMIVLPAKPQQTQNTNRPLRASAGASASKAQPQNMQEAIDAALGYAPAS